MNHDDRHPDERELLLQRYLDDDTTDDERRIVLADLMADDTMRRAMVETLSIRHLLRSEVTAAPAQLRTAVLDRVGSPERTAVIRPSRRPRRFPYRIAAATSVAMLALVSMLHTPTAPFAPGRSGAEASTAAPAAGPDAATVAQPAPPSSPITTVPHAHAARLLPSAPGIVAAEAPDVTGAVAADPAPGALQHSLVAAPVLPVGRPSIAAVVVDVPQEVDYLPTETDPMRWLHDEGRSHFVVDAALTPTLAVAVMQPRDVVVIASGLTSSPRRAQPVRTEVPPDRDQYSLGVRYRLDDHWSIGVEAGRATFRLVETDPITVQPPGPTDEQGPMALDLTVDDVSSPTSAMWVGACLQAEASVASALGVYGRLGAAMMSLGPMTRLGAGTTIRITQAMQFRVGLEGSALFYDRGSVTRATWSAGAAAGVLMSF